MELYATAKEAIKKAGLDYEVVKRDLFTKVHGHGVLPVRNHFATVRMPKDATETPVDLGVVGNYYTITQNEEAFDAIDYANAGNEILFEQAGSMYEGAQIYVEGVMGDEIGIQKNTTLQKRLILVNSHDGSTKVVVKMFFYDIKNCTYLAFKLPGYTAELELKHTKSVKNKLEEGRNILLSANATFGVVEKVFRELAGRKIEKGEAVDFITSLFVPNAAKGISTRTQNMIDAIVAMLEGRKERTLFDVYVAISQYVDGERGKNKDAEMRINSNWFGSGVSLKERAFDKVVKSLNSVNP